MIKLETDRLILRDYKETDLHDMHLLWSDKETMFYLDDILCHTIEDTKKYLQTGMDNADGHYFCICEKGADRFIGSIGYTIKEVTPLGKIVHMGYMMMPEFNGRGYMTEAAKKAIEFAFKQDDCVRITTGCVKEHEASRRVMEKAGFRKEGEPLKAQYHDGIMKDRFEYAINKDAFFRMDTSQIIIETERLILRGFTEADLADFYAYASVPGVGEMAGWPHHQSIEITKRILQSFITEKEVFAVFHKGENKVIGSLGVHEPPSWVRKDERFKLLSALKIGYVLAKDFWGQGLMPEAVKAVINYGFDTLGIDAFSIEHFVENAQSRRVIEKMGFEFVMNGEYHSKLLDKTFNERRYILLRGKST